MSDKINVSEFNEANQQRITVDNRLENSILEKLNITNKNLVSEAFKNLSLNFFPSVFNLSNQQAEIFETHFVLFKYYLILLNAQKDTLFAIPCNNKKVNSEKLTQTYFPGNFNRDFRKILISYKEIKKVNDAIAENKVMCIGTYLCSCENFYLVEPCGSPRESQ